MPKEMRVRLPNKSYAQIKYLRYATGRRVGEVGACIIIDALDHHELDHLENIINRDAHQLNELMSNEAESQRRAGGEEEG